MTTPGDSTRFDAIIVGSGAGGCAAAWQLARSGLQVALLEKGHELARDASTLDVDQVVHQGKFKSHERWLDNRGKAFAPEEYFNLGGKTKWYGAALLRYARHEFAADPPHQAPGWPIAYDDLAPYYKQAERLLGVRHFDCEADLCAIVARLSRRAPGWRHEPLPLGLAEQILRQPLEAQHFDGFASPGDLKGDGTTAFLKQVRALPNLRLHTGAPVTDLLAAVGDPRRVEGVRLADGTELRARAVLLAAGALHSPRLLQRYLESNQLAERLPCQQNLGRNLKLHLLTAMVALAPGRKSDLIRKTTLFLNDRLPHSSVQPLGFDGELIATLMPRLVPRWLARQLGARAYGFFLQTEDGAHPDNRVLDGSASTQGLPVMDYDASRNPAALGEHRQLVRNFRNALLRAGMLAFSQRIGIGGTAHVSGTMSAGTSPQNSVVDAQGLVHGLNSLYVVDGSVLPRSSRVNPSLSIYAWSLRTAERLAARLRAEAV
ncbi:MAG: GMC family oxidoreductase [Steroidobacteraceae bacterium]